MKKKILWPRSAKTIDNNGIVKNIDDVYKLPKFNKHDNGYNWIHLNVKSLKTRQWLSKYGLEKVWVEALTARESRPRFIRIDDDTFFINLRGINPLKNNEPHDLLSLRIYVTKNLIITTKIYDLMAIKQLQNDVNKDNPPLTTAIFISKLIDYINQDIESVIFKIHEEIDNLEEMSLVEHDKDFRQNVINIRRQMIIFRRYLQPNQGALKHLATMNNFYRPDHELYDHLIESEHKMTRFIEETHSVKERAQVIHEELNNHLTEQLNKSTHKLSAVATVFLPMTFITGLFGVNLAGIPFASNPSAFIYFFVIIISIFIIHLAFFKIFKWI
ncbi:MAG: hypothetical protein EKK61_04620 [Rickettsiales bacterium]|nr:MAG: hypothetical protein EKK61_04620 [Rickettsiales bacterium]